MSSLKSSSIKPKLEFFFCLNYCGDVTLVRHWVTLSWSCQLCRNLFDNNGTPKTQLFKKLD